MVRTLTNAFESGRLAHAFVLTGVRGVGKTTTARIIARALNCIGPDGKGGPTITPCGVCDMCRSIAEDRLVDVIEMDAASNTGVDNMRELIDGVRYRPVAARYKVYIIDEVHMLSKGAFNALLKTLEEPPAHVKFIFATTEIRKVPVTVLSRCQRFDLKRLDASVLMALFTKVAAAEAIPVEAEALQLIARAADGSARDGLSLLDQAMALAAGAVTAQQVRDMLGLTDRSVVIDLFAAAMSGRPADALAILADLHRSGADPIVVVQDLLDVVHGLTRLKVIPALAEDAATPEAERTRGADLAGTLTIPVLTRTWQMLLKGLGEVTQSPMPQQAAEMVIIRIAHAADLPPPGDIVRQLTQGGMVPAAGPGPAPAPGPGPGPRMTVEPGRPRAVGDASPAPAMVAAPAADALADPKDFPAVAALFAERREALIASQLRTFVHLVRFEPGHIEFRQQPQAPRDLANRVGQLLGEWTGRRWVVAVSSARGEATLTEREAAAEAALKDEAARHPAVKAVLDAFPGAKILEVRDLEPLAQAVAAPDLGDTTDMPMADEDAADEEGDL
jgi:DNA polymerase-3 subunit gamma/tau